MSINQIVSHVLRPSISAWELLPDLGDEIDFVTPAGKIVQGATVTKIEEFCGTTNFFVEYTYIAYDGHERNTSGWVALEQVV